MLAGESFLPAVSAADSAVSHHHPNNHFIILVHEGEDQDLICLNNGRSPNVHSLWLKVCTRKILANVSFVSVTFINVPLERSGVGKWGSRYVVVDAGTGFFVSFDVDDEEDAAIGQRDLHLHPHRRDGEELAEDVRFAGDECHTE